MTVNLTFRFTLKHSSSCSYLKLEGSRGVEVSASSGDLSVRSLNNVNIVSREGKVTAELESRELGLDDFCFQIILTTANLHLPQLPTLNTTSTSESRWIMDRAVNIQSTFIIFVCRRRPHSSVLGRVYQVCVCGGGRLFLAPPDSACVANKEICF